MLIGQGAAGAADEVVQVAELLGAGVAKALLGKAVLPDDLPFVTGPVGLLGSTASYEMMENCDTLLMVGTSFPYSEWLPEEGKARCVEIDLDGRMIGIRYPTDVALVGDAKDTLKELIPKLERKEDRSWRERIEKEVAEWWRVLDDRAHEEGEPANPQRVIWELSQRLPDRAIVCADSGSSTNWWARHLKLREGMKASLSGTLATMGPGTPYAIAAKFAFPDRPVIAIVGDGAFQMNGMNELITVKRYWERYWKDDPRLVFCVFNNQDLNQVTWEQRVLVGRPEVHGHAVDSRRALPRVRQAARPRRRLLRVGRRRSATPGPRRCRPAGRACSRSRPTRRSRRSRRTFVSTRRRRWRRRWSKATRSASGSWRSRWSGSCRSSRSRFRGGRDGRRRRRHGGRVVEAAAYEIPTDGPDGRETDGTLAWDSTTIVVVHAGAGGETGLGYTYAHAAAARWSPTSSRR